MQRRAVRSDYQIIISILTLLQCYSGMFSSFKTTLDNYIKEDIACDEHFNADNRCFAQVYAFHL